MRNANFTETEQLDFFNQCQEQFVQAGQTTGLSKFHYDIAGTHVCLEFAGEALIQTITRALVHLQVDTKETPEITIGVWDSASTSVNMTPPPCHIDHFTDRGDIWGFNSNRIKTAFHWSDYSVNLLDTHQKRGIYWVNDAKALPYWVQSSPLRTLFHWWMELQGNQLLHAAAVGNSEACVLIPAKGGSGKSTTSLLCLDYGLQYLADDYLILQNKPNPKVYSLYSTAKILKSNLTTFCETSLPVDLIPNNQSEKEVIYLYPQLSGKIVKALPLIGILVPEITLQPETSIHPISADEVHRAMAFTTLSQLPGAGSHTYNFIQNTVSKTDCYKLKLGTRFQEVAPAISHFLDNPQHSQYRINIQKSKIQTQDYPMISIILPIFNGARFIEVAIDNILSQNYPDIEIIAVDDGSTDQSLDILNRLKAEIRILSQDNKGPAAARNRGIKEASGKYITFLDVDDLWPKNNLLRLARFMDENQGVGVVKGHGQELTIMEDGSHDFMGSPGALFDTYIGSALYRTEVFQKVGLFNEHLIYGEDGDWFDRAKQKDTQIIELDEVTLFVRRHGNNHTVKDNFEAINNIYIVKSYLDNKRKQDRNTSR